jgi:hypothetical protein
MPTAPFSAIYRVKFENDAAKGCFRYADITALAPACFSSGKIGEGTYGMPFEWKDVRSSRGNVLFAPDAVYIVFDTEKYHDHLVIKTKNAGRGCGSGWCTEGL